MNWFKENTVLIVRTAVLLVVLGAGLFSWLSESSRVTRLRSEIDSRIQDVTQMRAQAINPDEKNIKIYAGKNAELEKTLSPVVQKISQGRVRGEAVDGFRFQEKFKIVRDALIEEAKDPKTKTVRVALPENFSLGFQRYLSTLPPAEATPLLTQQLEIIQDIVRHLYKARVSRIDAVSRLPVEDVMMGMQANNGTAPGDAPETLPAILYRKPELSYDILPFVIKFSCNDTAFRAVVNKLTDSNNTSTPESPKPLYIIRSVEIKNQMANSPTIQDLKDNPNAAGSGSSSVENASVQPRIIFGQELMDVLMRVDYVEWKTEESQKVWDAAKPKPVVTKTKDKKTTSTKPKK